MGMPDPIQSVRKLLKLSAIRRHLPKTPKVIDIRLDPHIDSLGDNSLRVYVLLDENTSDQERTWERLESIERLIRDRVESSGLPLFPYIRYLKPTEVVRGVVA